MSVKLWERRILPYVIDSSLGNASEMIHSAMNHIMSRTVVRFVPRRKQKDYILISNGRNKCGCKSCVGKVCGQQNMYLGPGCLEDGIVIHELMHSVGLVHEHNHPERDRYIRIFWNNIDEDYHKEFHPTYWYPYHFKMDCDSIMMYGSDDFARYEGKRSMETLGGKALKNVHEKKCLSKGDVEKVNKLYGFVPG